MPKRTDISSILIIGAGPIVIGQACEFDYSGTQACKALKEEGYRIILVNSNPATIMTDPNVADATYIEPITPEFLAKIIEKERPDALLPTMGGQTALNAALSLERAGVLAPSARTQTWAPEPLVRPPVLCAGCPHMTAYMAARALDARVAGDIGCYTLATLAPLRGIDTSVAMGSSIGNAIGMAKAGETRPVVATIGARVR